MFLFFVHFFWVDINFYMDLGMDYIKRYDLIYINDKQKVVSCSFQFSFALPLCNYFLILSVLEFHTVNKVEQLWQ